MGIFAPLALAAPVFKDAAQPGDIYEGQKVQLKLNFEWPASEGDYELKIPKDITLHNFEFLGQDQSLKISSSGLVSIVQCVLICELLPSAAGQGRIDSFYLLYRKSESAAWHTLAVPGLQVTIKPALPVKQILVLSAVFLAIVLPLALWLIQSSAATQRHERDHPEDPKQAVYQNAVKVFENLISGVTGAYFRGLAADWFYEFTRVVITYHDLPAQLVTKAELIKGLAAKNVSAEEIEKVGDLWDSIEPFKSASDLTGGIELEQIRLLLLQYVKGKITAPNL